MKARPYLLAAALVVVGLGALYNFAPARPQPPVPDVPQKNPRYFAEYTEDCGLRLMKLARAESGPAEVVFPMGPQAPDERLRPHAWRAGRFVIQGRWTGKQRESPGCGTWPEFEVTEFEPWRKVRRCTSPGAADPLMLLYVDDLPADRYASEDFVDGAWPPLIEDESCRLTEACAEGERHITACTGKAWCCRLMSRRDEPRR